MFRLFCWVFVVLLCERVCSVVLLGISVLLCCFALFRLFWVFVVLLCERVCSSCFVGYLLCFCVSVCVPVVLLGICCASERARVFRLFCLVFVVHLCERVCSGCFVGYLCASVYLFRFFCWVFAV